MERNDDFNNQNLGQSGSTGAGNAGVGAGYGASGLGGSLGAQDVGGSTDDSYGSSGTSGADRFGGSSQNATDEARNRFQQGKEAVTDRLGTLKEKAGTLNTSLADKLEAGAEKLRQRGSTGQLAGATEGGSTAVATDDRMAQVSSRVATGLDSTADWLRNGDLKETIEQQVKTNPGRTLLIALGLGYVLGKAFRR